MKKLRNKNGEGARFSPKSLFGTLQSRNGLFAAVAILVAAAIVIVVNLAVERLPAGLTQRDLSSEKIYTVSDTSRDLLNALEDELEIVVLAPNASVDQRISTYLELYCGVSDKLKLKTIDTTLYPSALTEYDTDSNCVVVRNTSNGKQEVIPFDDILLYDAYSLYYYGEYVYTEFDAEGQLTSAVSLVTSSAAHTIYCDSGHGETSLGSSVSELIKKNNLSTASVNLLTDGGVPEGCELLLFNQPASDLSADELEQVEEFLAAGGHVMVILDSSTLPEDFPNLCALTGGYGINILSGGLADQYNYYQYFGSAFVFFPDLSSSDAITSGISSSEYVLVGYDGTSQVSPCIPLEVTESSDENRTVTTFLTTSEYGVAYTSEEDYQTGTFAVAAYAADASTGARLTVIGADTLINDSLLSAFSGLSNLQVFMNAATAGFEDMDTISIASKSLTVTNNTVRNPALWTLVFVILLPVLVLAGGFIHWFRRRKL